MSQSRSETTKEKIIQAAMQVIKRDGLHACTHRTVAAEADISPGTTTYHFATLDALLIDVMHVAIDEFTTSTDAWLRHNTSGSKEAILTRFVLWTLSEHSRLATEYELFVAAISRPLLRPCAIKWLHIHESLLVEHLQLTASQARAAVSFIDAWLMRGILSAAEATTAEETICAVFHTIVHGLNPEKGR